MQQVRWLARHHNVTVEGLDDLAISDPYDAVVIDVAALRTNPDMPVGFMVSGLVYDVATGKIDLIGPPTLLRPDAQ